MTFHRKIQYKNKGAQFLTYCEQQKEVLGLKNPKKIIEKIINFIFASRKANKR
jgi:hypothetical protein